MHLQLDFVSTRLLAEGIGGNATSRFIFFTSLHDYTSNQIEWICEMSTKVRFIRNYPVIITAEIQMLIKRFQETQNVQSNERGTVDGGNWKQSQIEADLQKRINLVIEANAQLQETISKFKKEVGLYQKRVLDMKIQCSRMEDEMLLKEDKLIETMSEMNKFKSLLAEKKGNQTAASHKNQKMSLKIRELEWHIVQLLNREVLCVNAETRTAKKSEVSTGDRIYQEIQRLSCQEMCKLYSQTSNNGYTTTTTRAYSHKTKRNRNRRKAVKATNRIVDRTKPCHP
jgi:chromosome segregation ATPase